MKTITFRSIFLLFIVSFTWSSLMAQILPNRTLLNFSGKKTGSTIEINATLSASHTFDKIIIERGSSASTLQKLAELETKGENSAPTLFRYIDENPLKVSFYRIRLVNTLQNISEVSSILMVQFEKEIETGLSINNTIVSKSNPGINIQSNVNIEASLDIFDWTGRAVGTKKIKLNNGTNLVNFETTDLKSGYYFLHLRTNSGVITRKIFIE